MARRGEEKRPIRREPTYIPIKEIVTLARQGYNDSTIIRELREKGYTPRQINDAFNQAKIKAAAGDEEGEQMEPSIMTTGTPAGEEEEMEEGMKEEMMAPAPADAGGGYGTSTDADAGLGVGEPTMEEGEGFSYPQAVQYPTYESRPSTEVIEEIAEEIINEKWRDFKVKAGDFGMLRKFFEQKLKSLSLRTKKMETSVDKINDSVMESIREYNVELKNLRAQVHALEMAFSKILEPLVTNIRKLEEGVAEKELVRLKKKEVEEDLLESRLIGKRKVGTRKIKKRRRK